MSMPHCVSSTARDIEHGREGGHFALQQRPHNLVAPKAVAYIAASQKGMACTPRDPKCGRFFFIFLDFGQISPAAISRPAVASQGGGGGGEGGGQPTQPRLAAARNTLLGEGRIGTQPNGTILLLRKSFTLSPDPCIAAWVGRVSPHARLVWRFQFPSLLHKCAWYELNADSFFCKRSVCDVGHWEKAVPGKMMDWCLMSLLAGTPVGVPATPSRPHAVGARRTVPCLKCHSGYMCTVRGWWAPVGERRSGDAKASPLRPSPTGSFLSEFV